MEPKLMRLIPLVALGLSTACIVRTVSVESMTRDQAVGTNVRSPLKAFHTNGTITVFPRGARVSEDQVIGQGTHYSLDLRRSTQVASVPLDSIVGIEAFHDGVNPAATLTGSVLIAAGVVIGAVAIACIADPKCFGSCPTIYSYEDGSEVLEAEAFSYSISPLLEGRDVDLLGVRPDADGILSLEIRNEALETHYINHLELLEARHDPGRRAYPNEAGRIVSVGPVLSASDARDRDGVSRAAELRSRDDLVFASSEERMRAVTSADYRDHVELTFPRPATDSAALVLRLRNSLLNSVLFYDLMLGSQGAEALQWLGTDVNRIGEAVELGRWFYETMGMRISVEDSEGWVPVARIGDSGPIAWKELAVTVPVPETDELRIRLTFLADEWRIDYAALAPSVERAEVRPLPVMSVGRIGGAANAEFRARLAEPDEDYLVTTAGTALAVHFRASPVADDADRTFFLASQGYYTEWIRPQWIRSAASSDGFRTSPDLVVDLMSRWLEEKQEFEKRFYETRIPVR